jgi:hypothetical protein
VVLADWFFRQGVAEAIRNGWILDNMPNPDTDVDLCVDNYLYYKKYGVLPEGQKRSSSVESKRQSVGR